MVKNAQRDKLYGRLPCGLNNGSLYNGAEAKGEVDVDLSCEGSCKVSRRQAYLTLEADGRFKITNAGQRLMLVDGKHVSTLVATYAII
eukprot:258178-Pelagomonas_calceolata.AAC.3